MDCVARDSEGKQFDVEIQQDNEGASPKRARYHSGLMDMNTLNPGQDFDELPESYVIFITRDDILGYGFPIYHIDRHIKEADDSFQDEAHIIYVNSQIKDDTVLGRLMHDFSCTKVDDMHYPILADRVRYFKEDAKGVAIMCKVMEDMRNEAAREAALKAAREADRARMIKTARRMWKSDKFTYTSVSYTHLTLPTNSLV